MNRQNLCSILLLTVLMLSTSFFHVYAQESNIIELIPTDDSFVSANVSDPNNLQEYRKLNYGNLDYLRIGYMLNNTEIPNTMISIAFLKFDLSDISEEQIDSAKLQLYTDQMKLSTPQKIGVFFVNNSTWSESTITYDTIPEVSDLISTVTIDVADSYQWELGDVIKQNAGKQLSLMVSFVDLLPNTEDIIIFASKDLQNTELSPALIITDTNPQVIPTSIKLRPTDDSIILNNHLDLNDTSGMAGLNFGNHTSINILYSRNAIESQELVITTGFFKFDVSQLDLENIQSATFNMYQYDSITTDADRMIALFSVSDDEWNESEITFMNKPSGDMVELDIIPVTTVNQWYSWNVTDAVKNSDEQLTLSTTFKNFMLGHEEQAIFFSSDSSKNIPYLEISFIDAEYEVISSDSESQIEGGGCLIATATFGTELAPQVQLLREIRDNQLMNTDSGISFMNSFNQFYYSFSPYIADMERESPAFKEAIKIGITPLLSSLSIMSHADSESKVLGYGISVILMNIGMYFVAPTLIIMKIFSWHKFKKI